MTHNLMIYQFEMAYGSKMYVYNLTASLVYSVVLY